MTPVIFWLGAAIVFVSLVPKSRGLRTTIVAAGVILMTVGAYSG